MTLLWIFLALAVLVLLIAFICFFMAFFVPKHGPVAIDDYTIPDGEIYEPYRESMVKWMKEVRAMPHEDFYITSHDGLKLHGRYYEYAPGAPIELMVHGYRGNGDRDLCGGVQRCFKLGRSALVIDQRASGESEGKVITFGVKEHLDCRAWAEFMAEHFGPDAKIILTGISMGASTVLIAAGKELPKNVIGVLADCGFHSAKDVICSVARSMYLPSRVLYPFVRFAAKTLGKFDLEEISPVESIAGCKIPVLFFHGESDDYVPSYMSKINYEACTSRKKLVLIPGAGHGLSFPVDQQGYLAEMEEFFHKS